METNITRQRTLSAAFCAMRRAGYAAKAAALKVAADFQVTETEVLTAYTAVSYRAWLER